MHRLSNKNRQIVSRVRYTDRAPQAGIYKVFLEMRELLEDYAPTWYPETLHKRTEAIIREYSVRTRSKHQKDKPLRGQKLIPRSGLLPAELSRQLASQAIL